MANMKITFLATRYRQLQVEMQDGIVHSVVEDELNDIQAPPEQLRNPAATWRDDGGKQGMERGQPL